MTHDEEMAARGRLLTDYSEDTKHLATLRAEAEKIGAAFEAFGSALRKGGHEIFVDQSEFTIGSVGRPCRLQAATLNPDKLRELVKDILDTEGRIKNAKARLEVLGLLVPKE